jgi:hypothetical protein
MSKGIRTPTNEMALLATGAGGACRSAKTTPLLSADQGIMAMKQAGGSGYEVVGK